MFLGGTINEAKRWPSFLSGIHVSRSICCLFLQAGSGELAWAQVTKNEFSDQMDQMGSLPLWTGPEAAPGRVTEGWRLYMFKITSWWSQSHSLSSGALPRVWCKHIRNAYGDNDVYVFSLNLSSMAASLRKRRKLHHSRPVLPPSFCLPRLQGWSPWDFIFFFTKNGIDALCIGKP